MHRSLPSMTMTATLAVLAEDDGLKLSGGVRLRFEEIEGQPRAGFDHFSDDDASFSGLTLRAYLRGVSSN